MHSDKGKKVPATKLARLSKLGQLVTQVTGNVALEGMKQLSQGEKPKLSNLIMHPNNIKNVADKLAQMRGAAMKLGQLISMDAGDLIPKELSALLSQLRSNARPMPNKQLLQTLKENWGDNWLDNFSHFELSPFASASIGQVHLAYDERGTKLAIKIQYPGVRQSIDADVDNVAKVIKLSGLLPKHIELDSLLQDVKTQLKIESDYLQESKYLSRYAELLKDDGNFIIPTLYPEHITQNVLPMTFVGGVEIDKALAEPQEARNRMVRLLIELFFKELFSFKLMQTDPNFANYLYQSNGQKVVLLDFGATREISCDISEGYLALINAACEKNTDKIRRAAMKIGFFKQDIEEDYFDQIATIFSLATEPLQYDGVYDFSTSSLAQRIQHAGQSINNRKDQWHTPPVDALFIHRKLAGLYLLAAKLEAKVNVAALFKPYLSTNEDNSI
ncbi:ubiquinol-cytochrome C reductase [Pseudoalteromonas sp. MSK9-3]|uniref:ABC1 kinase family protein n=1 Tax=Pseudoalteromonas sp. MSK9-3 TaxID=1897633 RepID=UPI000E6B8790|nr:AarF/ABC1/UbiB kinase family protein [Pseudoalteromonas sp. MSK9-3]RJE77565.1 ubiquinol-cytochrome C reductase [Pseudoalteromonas sp. MSK9-3]